MDVDLSGALTPVERRIDEVIENNPDFTTPMVLGRLWLDPDEHYDTVEKRR